MRILALQLKRIGDLILTTPALAALRQVKPEAQITVAAYGAAAALLPALPDLSAGVVFGPGRGWTPWQQVLTGPWDAVLDFTGTDRSALATAFSRAPRRVTFEWVRKKRLRSLVYNGFVDSAVRTAHTADHYADLLEPLGVKRADLPEPRLAIPSASAADATKRLVAAGIACPSVLIHPGTARPEKYWLPERWAEVISHIRNTLGLDCVMTGGTDPFEKAHLAEIAASVSRQAGTPRGAFTVFSGTLDLLTLAALAQKARLVVSCDTAMVHFAAAFRTPQIALFGPTNPFHWRPRHPSAVILSASRPDAPVTEFEPRMKGAPMDRLSTELVIHATDSLFKTSATLPAS